MQTVFTKDDILRFIYNELPKEESKSIENAIRTEPVMQKRYNRLMNVVNQMDAFSVEPSNSSIDLIMEYSRDMRSVEEASH